MDELSSRANRKHFISPKKSVFLSCALIAIGTSISLIGLSTRGQSTNKQPYHYLSFSETTYSFVKDYEVTNDIFSMKGSSFKIEKNDSSPKDGQLVTPKDSIMNEGLLITFKGSLNENLVFGQPEIISPDTFEYNFEFEDKEYKLVLGAVDGNSSEDIRIEIFEPSEGDKYGRHNYLSVAYFSKE